ncbi:MAG: transporter [Bacillota bacterium]|nr:transporter [Bacillota bacterium]
MVKNLFKILQVAAVFIGTIVGAGLASGKEITQFFTSYGVSSFIGILICGVIYILVCSMFVKISTKHGLKSYDELIRLISPGFLGEIIDIFTSFFLMSGAAVILAGSGALLNQYFGFSKWIGILIMVVLAAFILMKDTQGLIGVNTIIVPSLIIVISTIFILYVLFSKDLISIGHLKSIPYYSDKWFLSTIIYAGFNILCCSGVLVPLAHEYKRNFIVVWGVTLGAIGLTLLCGAINLMLMLNVPYIYKYEIPLLYISHRFGSLPQIMLLVIIWLEMFSTVVSDVYSVGKALQNASEKEKVYGKTSSKAGPVRKLLRYTSYKKSIFLIILIALPISQIGFSKLIQILYPSFGVISVIFIIQCCYFFMKNKLYR